MPKQKLVALPSLLQRKIYKTSQTRGADDDQVFQNRVKRASTVLVPFSIWKQGFTTPDDGFENGFIILISPNDYFEFEDPDQALSEHGLEIGENALLFYETRAQWNSWCPSNHGFEPASSRTAPLAGHYVARVPSTTRSEDNKIADGFSGSQKGAGIRVYEYADSEALKDAILQLESIFWHCDDAVEVCADGNEELKQQFDTRRTKILQNATDKGLLDYPKLIEKRILDVKHNCVCPLCQKQLSAIGFLSRMSQAVGREVPDLTVTQINLFHIRELRSGEYNHRPYNLGWGCHHCNTVARDMGLTETLDWMKEVLDRNNYL